MKINYPHLFSPSSPEGNRSFKSTRASILTLAFPILLSLGYLLKEEKEDPRPKNKGKEITLEDGSVFVGKVCKGKPVSGTLICQDDSVAKGEFLESRLQNGIISPSSSDINLYYFKGFCLNNKNQIPLIINNFFSGLFTSSK